MPTFLESLEAIRSATTADAVVAAMRGYLEALPPEDILQLPWGLAAEVMRTPTDIALWALHVGRAQMTEAVAGAEYGRVSRLLAEASVRLAAISAEPQVP